jgi:hypothetical protein
MESINFDALRDELRDISGDDDLELIITSTDSNRYVYITSTDLKPETVGVFGKVFSKVYFTGFISKLDVIYKKNFELKISLGWDNAQGGSNGTDCLWGVWNYSEMKWSFIRLTDMKFQQ